MMVRIDLIQGSGLFLSTTFRRGVIPNTLLMVRTVRLKESGVIYSLLKVDQGFWVTVTVSL